jgi:hypothetical protein
MRGMEREGQYSKKEAGDRASTAPKEPRTRSLNALLEAVRKKMAYTIRGI